MCFSFVQGCCVRRAPPKEFHVVGQLLKPPAWFEIRASAKHEHCCHRWTRPVVRLLSRRRTVVADGRLGLFSASRYRTSSCWLHGQNVGMAEVRWIIPGQSRACTGHHCNRLLNTGYFILTTEVADIMNGSCAMWRFTRGLLHWMRVIRYFHPGCRHPHRMPAPVYGRRLSRKLLCNPIAWPQALNAGPIRLWPCGRFWQRIMPGLITESIDGASDFLARVIAIFQTALYALVILCRAVLVCKD